MPQRYVTRLDRLINPAIDERVTQIQLELEHNPRRSSRHAVALREYQQARSGFEAAHPELKSELDDVLSAYCQVQDRLACAAYKQGAADCARLLRFLFHGKPEREEEQP